MNSQSFTGYYESPQPDSAKPRPVRPSGPVPPTKVLTAFNFIAMCNEQMGFRSWDSKRVHNAELHFAQEVAFRSACNVMCSYFDDAS